jgi:hypothetical protein
VVAWSRRAVLSVFPVLILATKRWAPDRIFLILSLVTLASFLFSTWSTGAYPIAAFYRLPSRAWELGVGALLAVGEIQKGYLPRLPKEMRFRQFLAPVGLVAILAAIVGIDPTLPFPGLLALLPVWGTAALIVTKGSWVNRRLLAARPMVFVGLISYSWYLWHWPLMSYLRIISVVTPPVWMMTIVAAMTFALAYLSWRWIEQPFRHASLPAKRTILAYGAVLFVAVCGAAVIQKKGLPHRLPTQVRAIEAAVHDARGDTCLAGFPMRSPVTSSTCQPAEEQVPGVALIGDSHAAALSFGVRDVAQDRKRSVWEFTKASCGPLLDTDMPKQNMPDFASACRSFMAESFRVVASNPTITTVIIAGKWDDYWHLGSEAIRDGLTKSLTMLRLAGKHVILLSDVPLLQFDPIHLELARTMPLRGMLARALWQGTKEAFPASGTSQMVESAEAVDNLLQQIAKAEGADWIDVASKFCTAAECMFEHNGDFSTEIPSTCRSPDHGS